MWNYMCIRWLINWKELNNFLKFPLHPRWTVPHRQWRLFNLLHALLLIHDTLYPKYLSSFNLLCHIRFNNHNVYWEWELANCSSPNKSREVSWGVVLGFVASTLKEMPEYNQSVWRRQGSNPNIRLTCRENNNESCVKFWILAIFKYRSRKIWTDDKTAKKKSIIIFALICSLL